MSTGRRVRQPLGTTPEPELDPGLLASVRRKALENGGSLDPIALAEAVTEAGTSWGSTGAAQTLQKLRDEVQGLSVLEQFASAPGVSDVLVDHRGAVWTDSSKGLERTGYAFNSPQQVRRLAAHFAAMAGKRLDEASPYVDVTVRNYRIHAVLPPIAADGPVISIRVKGPKGINLEQLLGDRNSWWGPLLRQIMCHRLNFLISGGTGAGKTTLLQAMLALVPENQRIVVIEDSKELSITHEHVISLQTRAANVESSGAVTLSDLVVQALRMRPDRLIVGECRGAEIRDFLAAMNTGHQGAAGTIHANDPAAIPARLAALGALAGWDTQATALQANSALDLLLHVDRDGQGRRGPVKLSRLVLDDKDRIRVVGLIDATAREPLPEASAEWIGTRFPPQTINDMRRLLGRHRGSG
ncbi:TadA family conjugal transfer-associated ATPase [Glutamicibacter sp. MNS18]|uniref:TadA family conjugal transfer-associated ATPase n=1 Tax=Glutamicibacter sp. MNS18 TaxID=2989817 RepID=UPI002235CB0F|nr:TadA family conjugal transfer-associated ATPase [Glutamicibacter sp. MNS18]MCW4464007.1 TadA family conjugal transfer-associated ATPase [Glutamicibacter sp. MNS18]